MSQKTSDADLTDGKRYWRSLEQLADDAEFRQFLEAEFPREAAVIEQGVDRRQMLTLMGAALAFAGLASCRRPVEKIVPYVAAPEDIVPGIPKQYATTFSLGMEAIGLLVESQEGRPGKIEGNPDHPFSLGATSARIQAEILSLFDPDRSQDVTQGEESKTWGDFLTAFKERETLHLADAGAGLAVLLEPFSSPTVARLAAAFRARFPQARFVAWQPLSDESARIGLDQASGRAVRPVYRFDSADVVVALDCDFLLNESDSVIQAKRFARRRRIRSPQDNPNRLYAVESGLSLTGANADHRLAVRPTRIGAFAAALAQALQSRGVNLPIPANASSEGFSEAWLNAVADDLTAAGSSALVVAGRRQPPEVHALVFAINAALGSLGKTVQYFSLEQAQPSDSKALAELTAAMAEGQVKTLAIFGANPVYNAPADLAFERALSKVEFSFHCGLHRDETGRRTTWQVPTTHFLEQWGDARAADGTLSVVQPLIAPLYGGHSPLEVLARMATGVEAAGHDLVRETWRPLLPEGAFETEWRRVLHDGLLKSELRPVSVGLLPSATSAAIEVRGNGAIGDLEIEFYPGAGPYDGRGANNAWLQEMPDPITKMVWGNAALMSAATAESFGRGNSESGEAHKAEAQEGAEQGESHRPEIVAYTGLRNGDVVLLTYRGHKIELPVWIQPAQADGVVAVALGYGRTGGRIADGVGANGFALTDSGAPGFDAGLRLQRTRRKSPIVQTQNHGAMEGREIILEASLREYRSDPRFAELETPTDQLFPGHGYENGHQWGMAIDLNACTGCSACVIACQSENNIPVVGKEQVSHGREMHWLRVDRYYEGSTEAPRSVFQPMPCQHCENAPCEEVCPVAATVHSGEGLNLMVYNRCIGTRYCSNNCPYKVRRFNFFNYTKDTPESLKLANNPDVTVRSRGVMEKCSYCIQRINGAKNQAKLEGRPVRDGEVQTACQQACPSEAIVFGDINDPQSAVVRAKAMDRSYILLAELNNRPRTSYLAKVRNTNPALAEENS